MIRLGDRPAPDAARVELDDDGTTATDDDDETVTFDDVLPDITVTKTGSPTEVPATGGDVTFTFTVKNNSLEDATITALSDDQFGTLAGDDDCKVGTVLGYNETCSFEATFSIPAGDVPGTHVNVFTGTVTDGDGNNDSDTDDETITYTDRAPAVNSVKTVDANKDGTFNDSEPLLNADGTATYKYQLTNTSPAAGFDPLTIDTLVGLLAV